jgi:hypothetical protein
MYVSDTTNTTITIKPERCHEVTITVYPHSTVELVKHDTWFSLLVDGRHYRLVMAKFTHGRPEITTALNQALVDVEAAIEALRSAPTLTPTDAPAIITRIGEYDPETKQYPAFVSIDGEPERLVGYAWSAGAADRLCDEYAYHYYTDNHTPEAAAQIALAFASAEPETHCPDCGDPLYLPNGSGRCSCDTSAMWKAADERLTSGFCCGACKVSTASGPEPPVDDGPEDNFGGFRHPTPDTQPAANVNWSSAAASLARLRRDAAIRQAQATLKPAVADDTSTVIFELALTDPCALAEFLRGHTAVRRDQLAWRFAGWLGRRHGITVLPAFIAASWQALLASTAAREECAS